MAVDLNAATVLIDEHAMLALWFLGSLMIAATLVPASKYVQQDYHEFLSLGPGGTPSTVPGYLRIKALSCFALRDRYQPHPDLDPKQQRHGYLTSLPKRNRPRPETRGIAPHRQVTQIITAEVYLALSASISKLASDSNGRFVLGKSCFEKFSTALFSTSPKRKTCQGEICHAHPSDGSMHLTLSPEDAKVVLEEGWGEWHPLACGVLQARFVPKGFMLIYAPMNEEEVEIVMSIAKAAAWFVSGEDESARGGPRSAGVEG